MTVGVGRCPFHRSSDNDLVRFFSGQEPPQRLDMYNKFAGPSHLGEHEAPMKAPASDDPSEFSPLEEIADLWFPRILVAEPAESKCRGGQNE